MPIARIRYAAAVASAAAVCAGVTAPSASAASTPTSPVTSVRGDQYARSSPSSRPAAAPIQNFITNADLPHVSGSDISVHGWWEKTPVNATKATKAVVTVWLQAKPYGSNTWKRVGTGKGTYGPGPGRGNRATARITCGIGPTAPVSFRAEVDVDLVGYADSPEHAYGKVAQYSCLF